MKLISTRLLFLATVMASILIQGCGTDGTAGANPGATHYNTTWTEAQKAHHTKMDPQD